MKLLRKETFKRGIVLSSTFNVIAKLLNFLQTVVIAFYFGTINKQVDIYFYCLGVVTLLSTSIGLLNQTVLLPEAIRLRNQVSEEKAMFFLNKWLYIYGVVGAVFTLITVLFPVEIYTVISKFETGLLHENVLIIYFTIPLFTLIMANHYLISILTMFKFFTAPQIVKIINNSFALLFLIAFHNVFSISSILIGLLLGFVINNVILLRILIKYCNWKFRYTPFKLSMEVIRDGIFSFIGHFYKSATVFLGSFLLSGLGTGVIAAMNFGQRLASIANEMVTLQFSPVAGVKFSEIFSQNKHGEANQLFLRTTYFLNFILIPVSTILFFLDKEIVTILYKRGAFDTSSIAMVSAYLKQFGLSLSLVSINNIVSRTFLSAQKMKQYFWYLIIKNTLLAIIIFFAVKKIGGLGYPVALNISDFFNLFICYIIMQIHFPYINYGKTLRRFFLLVLLNFALGYGIYLLMDFFTIPWILIKIIAYCGLYGFILITITFSFKLNQDILEGTVKIQNKLLSVAAKWKR